MEILVCVLCFLNGAVLGTVCAVVLAGRGAGGPAAAGRRRGADGSAPDASGTEAGDRPGLALQWGNLLGYSGSGTGQRYSGGEQER